VTWHRRGHATWKADGVNQYAAVSGAMRYYWRQWWCVVVLTAAKLWLNVRTKYLVIEHGTEDCTKILN